MPWICQILLHHPHSWHRHPELWNRAHNCTDKNMPVFGSWGVHTIEWVFTAKNGVSRIFDAGGFLAVYLRLYLHELLLGFFWHRNWILDYFCSPFDTCRFFLPLSLGIKRRSMVSVGKQLPSYSLSAGMKTEKTPSLFAQKLVNIETYYYKIRHHDRVPRREHYILFATICVLFICMCIFLRMKSRYKSKAGPRIQKDNVKLLTRKFHSSNTCK